jgi:phosphoglycerate dehydrogenase-like enzyme
MRVLIPDAQFLGEPEVEREILGSAATIDAHRTDNPDNIPDSVWRAIDAIIVNHQMRIAGTLLDRLDKCRIVVRSGVGFDNIDIQDCAARGIAVCNVPDYGTGEVADHAMALMLALRRGLPTYTELLSADPVSGWRWDAAPLIRRMSVQTLGIIGLGRIGGAAAVRAKGFGLKVRYYDPYVPADSPQAAGYERADTLEDLLRSADIVSVHCPLTEETRNMIDAQALTQVKPGAILINTARGPVVDPDAVYEALQAGKLGGAGLDVLPQEPPDPDHRLVAAWRLQPSWLAGRLILTPHAAFYSPESWRDMRLKAASTIRDFLTTGRLRNQVNAHLVSPSALRGADNPG